MYGLLGLLTTSGENSMSTAPLEIYLLRKMETCSILILSAVCPDQIQIDDQKWIASIRMFDDFTYSFAYIRNRLFLLLLHSQTFSTLSEDDLCAHTRTHAHAHTHTHTHTHTHMHTLSLTHSHTHTLSLTHTHTHTLSLSLSLSLSHTHTHTHTHTLSLSHTRTHTLSLSLTHTHTHDGGSSHVPFK